MIMKQEAVHIQETKQDADDEWVKLHKRRSKRADMRPQKADWHLCPSCEAQETGQTEAEVMEATFKKQMEHKKNRVERYHEVPEKNSQVWLKSGSSNQWEAPHRPHQEE